jgi:hypothetical protein
LHSLELVGFEDVSKRLGTTGALAVSIVFREALRVVSHSVMLLNYSGLVDVRLSELLEMLGSARNLTCKVHVLSNTVISRFLLYSCNLMASSANVGDWIGSSLRVI